MALPRVDASLGLLDELALATFDAMGQLAPLVVPLGVVEEEAVLAKLWFGYVVLANVVEIALLRVREQPVRLGAFEVEVGAGELEVTVVVLGLGQGQKQ